MENSAASGPDVNYWCGVRLAKPASRNRSAERTPPLVCATWSHHICCSCVCVYKYTFKSPRVLLCVPDKIRAFLFSSTNAEICCDVVENSRGFQRLSPAPPCRSVYSLSAFFLHQFLGSPVDSLPVRKGEKNRHYCEKRSTIFSFVL